MIFYILSIGGTARSGPAGRRSGAGWRPASARGPALDTTMEGMKMKVEQNLPVVRERKLAILKGDPELCAQQKDRKSVV